MVEEPLRVVDEFRCCQVREMACHGVHEIDPVGVAGMPLRMPRRRPAVRQGWETCEAGGGEGGRLREPRGCWEQFVVQAASAIVSDCAWSHKSHVM